MFFFLERIEAVKRKKESERKKSFRIFDTLNFTRSGIYYHFCIFLDNVELKCGIVKKFTLIIVSTVIINIASRSPL